MMELPRGGSEAVIISERRPSLAPPPPPPSFMLDILIRHTASNLTASSFSFFLPPDGLINPVTFLHAALTQDVTVRPFVPGFRPSFSLVRSAICFPPRPCESFLSRGNSSPLFLNTDCGSSTAKPGEGKTESSSIPV